MKTWFKICATNTETGKLAHLFTYIGTKDAGIALAKREAVEFGMADKLVDFYAYPTTPVRQ